MLTRVFEGSNDVLIRQILNRPRFNRFNLTLPSPEDKRCVTRGRMIVA